MAVPWGQIIGALPALIDASARLFNRAEKPINLAPVSSDADPKEQLKAVVKRLEYFESIEADQAALLKQTIEQLQNVTVTSSSMARRANAALATSCVALLCSIGLFFFR